jgi:hypothetical protein
LILAACLAYSGADKDAVSMKIASKAFGGRTDFEIFLADQEQVAGRW